MSSELDKKNGPASVGALPDRGSNPFRGKNMESNTTRPTDEAIVSAMRMLEFPIHGLSMAAEIMGEMLDHDLSEIDLATGERRGIPRRGHNMTVILTRDQIERLSFLWNDVICRANKLRSAYFAALDGKEIAT
jgi:hypothetical protein